MPLTASPISAARCRLQRALAGALRLLLAAAPSAVVGETYYQAVNHNGSGDWNTLAHWNTNGTQTPAGELPVSINATDEFVSKRKGWILRSGTGVNTFGGGSLTLGGTHVLEVRSAGSMTTVPYLIVSGTPSLRAGYHIGNVTLGRLQINSGDLLIRGHKSAKPNFDIMVRMLVGKGGIRTAGSPGGTNRLSLLDAASFEGSITVESGKLSFMAPVSSGGAFVAPVPGDVSFDHDAEFTGLIVAGVVYSPGEYSAASLGFAGSGRVTVLPPPDSK